MNRELIEQLVSEVVNGVPADEVVESVIGEAVNEFDIPEDEIQGMIESGELIPETIDMDGTPVEVLYSEELGGYLMPSDDDDSEGEDN